MAHSGKITLANNDVENLEKILTAIADRSQHLKSFIESYVKFARLSSPQLQAVLLLPIYAQTTVHCRLRLWLTDIIRTCIKVRPPETDKGQMQ